MINRFEKFIIDITEIDLYWHRLATGVMKPLGLKGSYAIYFARLHHFEGMTAAELAQSCGKDKADVSRDLAALEKAGFIERVKNGESAYRATIRLTESGKALTEKIISKAETAVNLVGQNLSGADRECFYRVLDIITKNLQSLSRRGLADE